MKQQDALSLDASEMQQLRQQNGHVEGTGGFTSCLADTVWLMKSTWHLALLWL